MSVSRLQQLRDLLEPLHRIAASYVGESGQSSADRRDAHDLYKELGYIEKDSKELCNDTNALEFERFRLRPFLLRFHQTLIREHLALAKPAFGWPEISCDPSAVAFSGTARMKDLIRQACKLRHLKLLDVATGFGTADDRWDRLRSARIAVFDLSAEAVNLRASVYHELGASIALGQYPVVLASEGQRPPFDVDVQHVEISGRPSDLEAVCVALDKALFAHLRRSGRSSFDATVAQLKIVLEDPTHEESVVLKELESVSDSRIEALGLIEYLVDGRKHEGWALLYPRWPGAYPESDSRTCFHITPFAVELEAARNAVQQSCWDAGVEYRKGDQGPLSDIMRSIWLLTCQAAGIVADLTGVNDNVCVEVGMASALGRPILLTAMRSGDGAPRLYPDIEKLQVRFYKNPRELREYVSSFLTSIF